MATSTTISSTTSTIMLQHEDTEQPPTVRLQPPTNENKEERLKQIDELKFFLGTATNDWELNRQVHSFPLPTGESLSCVFWNDLFHVTGTDIVRTLLYRFHLFGRPVTNLKKFEEGIFSDLRNLKPGMDASLEEPKSEFLEMLYKNNCIRTQKKQKVFFWFSVPHDRLFLDALERDLKREKVGLEPTSVATAEPAISLSLDTTQELFDQLRKSMSLSAVATAHAIEDSTTAIMNISKADDPISPKLVASHDHQHQQQQKSNVVEKLGHRSTRSLSSIPNIIIPSTSTLSMQQPPFFDEDYGYQPTSFSAGTSPKCSSFELLSPPDNYDEIEKQKIFGAFSLFEGSPTYKQRQRRRALSFHPNGLLEDDKNRFELAAINPNRLLQTSHDGTTAEKVYSCPLPQCARLFKRLEHLKRHFRTHTMERPYSCNMCGKHFSRTDNLAQHKKTHNRSTKSVGLVRSKSSGKLNTALGKVAFEDEHSTKSRKRASSLRNSCNYNEIIDKLSVLTSNDVEPMPSIDYFSYRGGDMSRAPSSPSNSIPMSDEEIFFGPYEMPVISSDICMTDEIDATLDEDLSYDTAFLPAASFMYPMMDPSCSTTSSISSFLNQPQHVTWYSSMDEHQTLSGSCSPTNSIVNTNEMYSWQQT